MRCTPIILVGLTAAAGAQQTDPYTQGDAARMRRAGYVTFAPEAFRPDVVKHLPQTPLLFVETKHFILGSSLAACEAPKTTKRRRKFQKELAALRIVLPRVKKSARRIDAWLHLHLFAQRLERLYDEMQFVLRVTDSDFPKDSKSARYAKPEEFMGWGPYLGMRGKFRVLVMQKRSDLERLESAITGSTSGAGTFQHFGQRSGSLLYAVSLEAYKDQTHPDHTMRCQLRFSTAKNLLKAYRHYDFALPIWVSDGIGNLLLRDLDPGQFAFSAIRGGGEPSVRNAKWPANTRNLVKNGLAPSSAKLCTARDATAFSLNDHMASWSRVEYLRSLDSGRTLARFLRRIKQPIRGKKSLPSFDEVLAAQEQALQAALGATLSEFDAAWRQHVLKRYSKR